MDCKAALSFHCFCCLCFSSPTHLFGKCFSVPAFSFLEDSPAQIAISAEMGRMDEYSGLLRTWR